MKEEEGGVISTSLWARGRWEEGGREADSQAEERGGCCRAPSAWQAGRQGGESTGKEQRDGLIPYRKLLPHGEGLDAPIVEHAGLRKPCMILEIKQNMHFFQPRKASTYILCSPLYVKMPSSFDKTATKPAASTLISSATARLTSFVSSSVV